MQSIWQPSDYALGWASPLRAQKLFHFVSSQVVLPIVAIYTAIITKAHQHFFRDLDGKDIKDLYQVVDQRSRELGVRFQIGLKKN